MPETSPLRHQLAYLREDWKNNRSVVVRIALLNYRLSRGVILSSLPSPMKNIVRLVGAIVDALVVIPMGVGKLYPTSDIGPGIVMAHRMTGSIMHPHARIGKAAKIFHQVTIGNAGSKNGIPRVPKIGDNVTIFPGAILVGDIIIGNDVVIGPNALVTQDVATGSKVVAPRATILISRRTENGGDTHGSDVEVWSNQTETGDGG